MRRTEGAFGFKRALFRDQEALTGQLTAFFVMGQADTEDLSFNGA